MSDISTRSKIDMCGCFRDGCPICKPGTLTDPPPTRPPKVERFHPATWRHSLPSGEMYLSIPLPISSDDADDIEELLGLVMRRIRRFAVECPRTARPEPELHAGGDQSGNPSGTTPQRDGE